MFHVQMVYWQVIYNRPNKIVCFLTQTKTNILEILCANITEMFNINGLLPGLWQLQHKNFSNTEAKTGNKTYFHPKQLFFGQPLAMQLIRWWEARWCIRSPPVFCCISSCCSVGQSGAGRGGTRWGRWSLCFCFYTLLKVIMFRSLGYLFHPKDDVLSTSKLLN